MEKSTYKSPPSSLDNQLFIGELWRSIEAFQSAEVQNGSSFATTTRKSINKWMAFEDKNSVKTNLITFNHSISSSNGNTVEGKDYNGSNGSNVEESSKATPKSPGDKKRSTTEESCSHGTDLGALPRVSQELKAALETLDQTFVVTDASMPDCPIVYACSGFFNMTGYSAKEVIGKNCRFLQGPETEEKEVAQIRAAVNNGKSYCGRLLNYKKDGTPFWNLLTINPIKDQNGKTIYFIGMQVEVGKNEKAFRPNGLQTSLLRYDAHQKAEMALDSIAKAVENVKHHTSHVTKTCWHAEEKEEFSLDYFLPESAELGSPSMPSGQTYRHDSSNEINFVQEAGRNAGKPARISLGGNKILGSPGETVVTEQEPSIGPEILMTKDLKSSNSWDRIESESDRYQETVLADTLEKQEPRIGPEILMTKDIKCSDSWDQIASERDRCQEIVLADALECKEEDLVIINPRPADNPIITEDLWDIHSQPVFPRPHKKDGASWLAVKKITALGEKIGLHHFKPIKPLGCGDTGSVHLVELKGTDQLFAMKAMEKSMLLKYKKVYQAFVEREIISQLDHPFLPTLYASFQTSTHVCFITDFCPGGELFDLLDKQPMKIFKEEWARFFVAEVVIGLEYLHCLGIIYRDLKPENILLQTNGHIVLTDFDLSYMTSCEPQIMKLPPPTSRRKSMSQPAPTIVAEPVTRSNSFVGTAEYMAPEIIRGASHTSAIDWWALGILSYEMLYGRTPFKGKNRRKTFANILHKDLTFPSSIPVSLAARQFINALLQKDPANRLGSTTGTNDIKRHPFLREINWPLIRCMTPPSFNAPLQLKEKTPKN
uniref:non-specific serine/threonine protein kinase n=1 Tax=Larrea tridentata TaxID=66636 RepID=A0A126X293_LARTR|nr:putative LOV domain-containing protein [Larrea tridentata]